jgi:hypothetical protein
MVEGRPFGAFALLWELRAERRREIAWVELRDEALAARGRQWCTGEAAYALEYELETGPGYVTTRLEVRVENGPSLTLERGASPELEGVLDCDLGFSPLTNAMPVLRHGLHRAPGSCDFTMAWVAVPGLTVHESAQRYEHVRPGVVRYVDLGPHEGFTAEIEFDDNGLATTYPGLAERAA